MYFIASLLLVLSACGHEEDRAPYFVDVAREVGIDFRHTSGASGDYFLFETMGAGAAFLDYNGDGWLDVYLVDGFDLSPWVGKFTPVNLVRKDDEGFWVAEEYKAPLRFGGRVDSTAFLLRQDSARRVTQNRLFLNGAGEFVDKTAPTGVGDLGYGMGCAVYG